MLFTLIANFFKFFTKSKLWPNLLGDGSPNEFFFMFLVEHFAKFGYVKNEWAKKVSEDINDIFETAWAINKDGP